MYNNNTDVIYSFNRCDDDELLNVIAASLDLQE